MVAGPTNREAWEAIGYEVPIGEFRSNQDVRLVRPLQNSPNPLSDLWQGPLIQFKRFCVMNEEAQFVAEHVKRAIAEGLDPNQILVVIVGKNYGAWRDAFFERQRHILEALREQEINYFVPSMPQLNCPNAAYIDCNPNVFRMLGGVTVSGIHRAKGNEAELVFVVGADMVAENEGHPQWRNQLFVALTRARCWATLTAVGSDRPLYDEIGNVISAGNTFTFRYRPPVRNLDEDSPGD